MTGQATLDLFAVDLDEPEPTPEPIDDAHQEQTPEKPKPTPAGQKREYRCGCCSRKLTPDRWVYSTHTGSRYCLPGEGCEKRRKR